MIWTEDTQKLLLAFVLRRQEFFDTLSSRLTPAKAGQAALFEIGAVLAAASLFRERFGELPSSAVLLRPFLEETLGKNSWGVENKALSWVEEVYAIPVDVLQENLSNGRYLVYECLNSFVFRPQLARLSEGTHNFVALREHLAELLDELSSISTGKGVSAIRPLAEPERYLSGIKILETGFWLWDDLFNGLRHSEIYLILGPTGGGKTLMSVQLAVNVAASGPVYYATYEQRAAVLADPDRPDGPMQSDFLIRALGALGKLSRTEFDKEASGAEVKAFEELSEKTRKLALSYKDTAVARNFAVYDFTSAELDQATFSGLCQHIRAQHEKEELKLVVIDQFWPLVLRTCGALSVPLEPQRMRSVGQEIARRLVAFADELMLPIVLVHQLGASAAERYNVRPSVYGAAEIRTLGWEIENVAAITRVRPTGECGVIRAKARYSGEMNKLIRARLNGDLNRFERPDSSIGPLGSSSQLVQGQPFIASAQQLAEVVLEGEDHAPDAGN